MGSKIGSTILDHPHHDPHHLLDHVSATFISSNLLFYCKGVSFISSNLLFDHVSATFFICNLFFDHASATFISSNL